MTIKILRRDGKHKNKGIEKQQRTRTQSNKTFQNIVMY